mmetsp:Transcript_25243/g.84601  ORF Transcript_25243/g.84601 Transcript_25243/m.84601 type:complete len:301 (-) Transcript_25243:301-1203(-)
MAAASFQVRLRASWMPMFMPCPPTGGWQCAASPARKHRPLRKSSARRTFTPKADFQRTEPCAICAAAPRPRARSTASNAASGGEAWARWPRLSRSGAQPRVEACAGLRSTAMMCELRLATSSWAVPPRAPPLAPPGPWSGSGHPLPKEMARQRPSLRPSPWEKSTAARLSSSRWSAGSTPSRVACTTAKEWSQVSPSKRMPSACRTVDRAPSQPTRYLARRAWSLPAPSRSVARTCSPSSSKPSTARPRRTGSWPARAVRWSWSIRSVFHWGWLQRPVRSWVGQRSWRCMRGRGVPSTTS